MEKKLNQIIIDREKKDQFIKNNSKSQLCISLKANIPGPNKKIYPSLIIIRYFEHQLDKLFKSSLKKKTVKDGADGLMIIYELSYQSKIENAIAIKKLTMNLEEKNGIGRLADIDVHYGQNKSISRGKMRKCLICDNDAFVCGRLSKHSVQELLAKSNELVEDTLKLIITKMIKQSMELELNLHPKFGLVTPLTNGSHSDMNYELMTRSIETLILPLYQMFYMGLVTNDFSLLFTKIRLIGQKAEADLMRVTSGVNTYRGLIFGLGITLCGSGYLLRTSSRTFDDLFSIIKGMTRDLKTELTNLSKMPNRTFGLKAYDDYHIGGARLEAYEAFPSVRKIKLEDLSVSSLQKALISLIISADDTSFLKRAGSLELYEKVKNKFKHLNSNNSEEVNQLNNYCLEKNLSFGGAADLLIITIYLYLFKNYFFKEGGEYEKEDS